MLTTYSSENKHRVVGALSMGAYSVVLMGRRVSYSHLGAWKCSSLRRSACASWRLRVLRAKVAGCLMEQSGNDSDPFAEADEAERRRSADAKRRYEAFLPTPTSGHQVAARCS